jgi:hypothetical protein
VDSTTIQTLIERFDSRISSHIAAIIAIAFGAFTILTLLQGRIGELFSLYVFFLFILEVFVFPSAVAFCLFRASHYSMSIEIVKTKTDFGKCEKAITEEALSKMPMMVQTVMAIRKKFRTPQIMKLAIPTAYLIWFATILSVLSLPMVVTI